MARAAVPLDPSRAGLCVSVIKGGGGKWVTQRRRRVWGQDGGRLRLNSIETKDTRTPGAKRARFRP